eukprot:scaffold3667_cov110-Isochrysis_galbana.AAC.2
MKTYQCRAERLAPSTVTDSSVRAGGHAGAAHLDTLAHLNFLKSNAERLLQRHLVDALWQNKVLGKVYAVLLRILRRPLLEALIEGVAKFHANTSRTAGQAAPG